MRRLALILLLALAACAPQPAPVPGPDPLPPGGLPVNLADLVAVNDHVNQSVQWRSDIEVFGAEEDWLSVREALELLAGGLPPYDDCDGQAVAKWAWLTQVLAYTEDQATIGLGYALDPSTGLWGGHAWVLVWTRPGGWEAGGDPLVLDNGAATAEVVRLSTVRDRLRLVTVFNSSAWKRWERSDAPH